METYRAESRCCNVGIAAIAFRHDGIVNRPANAEIEIVPDEPTFIAMIVKPAHFLMQIGEFAEHAETVGEARRHIKLSRSFVAQLYTASRRIVSPASLRRS